MDIQESGRQDHCAGPVTPDSVKEWSTNSNTDTKKPRDTYYKRLPSSTVHHRGYQTADSNQTNYGIGSSFRHSTPHHFPYAASQRPGALYKPQQPEHHLSSWEQNIRLPYNHPGHAMNNFTSKGPKMSLLEELYSTDSLPDLSPRVEEDLASLLSPFPHPTHSPREFSNASVTNVVNPCGFLLELNSNIVGGDMSDLLLLSPELNSSSIPELKFDEISQTFSDTGNSSSGVYSEESHHGELFNLADELCSPSTHGDGLDDLLATSIASSPELISVSSRDESKDSSGDETPVNKSTKSFTKSLTTCTLSVKPDDKMADEMIKDNELGYILSPISDDYDTGLNDTDTTTTGSPMTSPELPKPTQESTQCDDKPPGSYISILAKAILSSPEQRMVLSDIYEHFLENYAFFRNTKCAWRNSIRHNLSVNECFFKDGRAKNGKGFYWAIHTACVEDFMRGDYDRRKARKRVMATNKQLSDSMKHSSQVKEVNNHIVPNRVVLGQLYSQSNHESSGGAMRNHSTSRDMRMHPYYNHGQMIAQTPANQRSHYQMTSPPPMLLPYSAISNQSYNYSRMNEMNPNGHNMYY